LIDFIRAALGTFAGKTKAVKKNLRRTFKLGWFPLIYLPASSISLKNRGIIKGKLAIEDLFQPPFQSWMQQV